MAERPFEPVPNTPLVADPTGDAIWKRWLQNLQRFLGNAVRGPGSSTDNAVARWDGTTGTFLQNSGVIIDDSNNVTGIEDLTVNGDTTLGSATTDTLTINCEDWTFGANWRATRDAGTVGAGVQNIQTFNSTFTGDAGGTTDVRALRNISTTLDANNFAVVQAFVSSYTHLGTGTITTSRNNFSPTILNAAGSVTNARGFETLFTLSSSGNITTADAFFASAPVMSATGTITTLNGLRVGNLGNSLVTNAVGLKVDNFTGSSVMIGVQSSLSAASGKHNLYIDGTADNGIAGNVKIGAVTAPAAPLDVLQGTLGSAVQILASTASNDDPAETVYQNKVTTTDATVTTIATVAIPASTTVFIESKVVARRTGGAAGTAEDGAAYMVDAVYKNVAGTATEIGESSVFSAEDQAGWNVTVTPSGSNALIQVTGAVNNNVSWVVTYRVYSVST